MARTSWFDEKAEHEGIQERATKLESRVIGLPAKGLFLHVETVMPRRRDWLSRSMAWRTTWVTDPDTTLNAATC